MMYTVIRKFADKLDNGHIYNAGDVYPREGLSVGKNRIEELSTNVNRCGVPLIKKLLKSPEESSENATPVRVPGSTREAKERAKKSKEK